jgi:tellurite resistance protein TerC
MEMMLIKTVEQAKRWLKIVVGFTLLVLGVAMVFSPAPGLLIMLLGLGILAAEFVWAKRLLNHLKEQGEKLRQTVFARADRAA